MEWRILGEENGQILITTADPIQTSASTPAMLYFSGQVGFVSIEDELNKICSIYGQGKYADTSKYKLTQDTIVNNEVTGNTTSNNNLSGGRSIKLEDLQLAGYVNTISSASRSYTKNASTGFIIKDDSAETPEDGAYKDFKYWDEYVGGTKTWRELTCPDSSTNASVTIVDPQHSYTKNSLGSTTPAYKMILKKSDGSTNANYWLASRFVGFASGLVDFRARRVTYGYIDYIALSYSYNATARSKHGVRPVVYLQSDINLSYDSTTQTYSIVAGS